MLVHYDFSGVSSTIVPDATGNGYAGVIRGCDRGGAFLDTDSVFGRSVPVLCLTGKENGGFLQLPDGILNAANGVTVSFYCKIGSVHEYGTLFSFGKDYCFYLSVLPGEDEKQVFLSPCATAGGRSQEAGLEAWASVPCGQWIHMAVTFPAGLPAEGMLWLDGEIAGTFRQRRMDASALQNSTHCFFGFGAFALMPLEVSLTDIRIFGRALKETEISSLFHIAPEERLRLEAESLAGLFACPLKKPPVLPEIGQAGIRIRWKNLTPGQSFDEDCFHRPPAGTPEREGILEAELSFQDHTLTRCYRFTIPPMPEDAEIAGSDAARAEIPFPGHVADDLTLPSSGVSGSSFLWTSSRPELMDSHGRLLKRPKGNPAEITLTLTSTWGKASVTRTFPLRILPDCCRSLPRKEYIPAASLPADVPEIQAVPAAMEDVALTGKSIFRENQQRCLNYLLLIDADRMLYNFRRAFGIPTGDTLPLGGWEEPAGLLRGHSTGHYLSALAHASVSTGDARYREKAEYIIKELRNLQNMAQGEPAGFRTACSPSNAVQSLWSREPGTWGRGFLSAYSPDQFALLEQFTPYATIWAPYYTLHKILAGLLDCYLLLHSEDALACARGIGGWIHGRLSATTEEQRAKMWKMYIAGEYGGMNESLARLYEITGDRTCLETAQMFDNPALFQGLAHGRDSISGIHANQHIPQIIGALAEFRTTGNPYYYHIARNFWELVVNRYMYSIGGVGRGENFREPDLLAKNIEGGRNCETCATYNMLKLTGMLYQYAPDYSPYMDYYERALVNHIAASQNPVTEKSAHHGVTYMLPIGPGARKEYSNDYDDFTCCHGTGMENHVRYTEHIYHHGQDGTLYLNLFLPSVYCWKEQGVTLSMEGSFPSRRCLLTVHTHTQGQEIPLKLKIRIPCWCRDAFRIRINEQPLSAPEADMGYYPLERTFADGDRIVIDTPYSLHLCYTGDSIEGYPAASLMYGPLVMTALSGQTEWILLNLPTVLEDAFTIQWDLDSLPVLWYDDLKFIPSYAAHNAAYHTYFRINQV